MVETHCACLACDCDSAYECEDQDCECCGMAVNHYYEELVGP